MTDKEIIWNTIEFLRHDKTLGHVNMLKTHWAAYEEDEQLHFRRLMLVSRLINVKNSWEFELTAEGIVVEENDFKENGTLKKPNTEYRRGIKTTLLGICVGFGLTAILLNNLHHTEPLIWSKVSHQSAQSEPPKKGGQIAEFRAN